MAIFETKKSLLGLGIFASGFVGLGYQIVWTKQLGAAIGLETPAILAIVTAFMGGFSIGAFTLDRLIRRSNSPLQWLAGLELLIGSWGIISFFLVPHLPRILDTISDSPLGGSNSAAPLFIMCLALFLPSTVAMGATLPAMEKAWKRLFDSNSSVGLVYGMNTMGAAIGVVTVTFLIIPSIGLYKTLAAICCVSLGIGIAILLTLSRTKLSPASIQTTIARQRIIIPNYLRLGILGLLGMSYQLLCVRVLSQSLENTVFTYASILSIYLIGISIGGFLFHRFESFSLRPSIRSIIPILASGLVLLSLQVMPNIPSLYTSLWDWANMNPAKMLLSETFIASIVLLLPTIGSGFLFTLLIRNSVDKASTIGIPLGYNLLGATIAPFLFWSSISTLGTRTLIITVGLGFLSLTHPRSWLRTSPAIAVIVALAFLAPSRSALLGVSEEKSKGRLTLEGASGVVSIVTQASGHKRLEVNNRFMMGGSEAAISERRQAHLPLLIHPAPRQALFLGVGTGITLGATAAYPELRVDGVELLPEILENLSQFSDWNRFPYPANIHLHRMDARRFVKQTKRHYDVIVADVFHPARDGAGLLYTQEHFEHVKSLLTNTGLFCQWLPLHQFDQIGLSSLKRTFENVFPHSSFWLLNANHSVPVIAFVGSTNPIQIQENRIEDIESNTLLFDTLKESQLHTVNRIMTCYLRPVPNSPIDEGMAPINTDDFQFVSYHAPFKRNQQSPFELLARFLPDRNPPPQPANLSGPVLDWTVPWTSFLNARDLYLAGQLSEMDGDLSTAINHYLEGISISPRFTLGYARCISIAMGMNASAPEKAIQLLEQLQALRPSQSLAKRLLDRMQSTP